MCLCTFLYVVIVIGMYNSYLTLNHTLCFVQSLKTLFAFYYFYFIHCKTIVCNTRS